MKNKILCSALISFFALHPKIDEGKAKIYDKWLGTLSEVITHFESNYYGTIDPEEAMSNAIKGYAERDPHTGFLEKKICKDLHDKMQGEFFGIGIVLPGDKKQEEEFFPVIETVPGGPAEKAGVKAGDKIIQIENDLVKGLEIDEIMAKLKGEKNTQVQIKLLREKYPEPLILSITRDIVKDEMALAYYFPDQKIHYLLLSIFSEKSTLHVESMITKALENKSNGIILDLRNNTGGLFDSAINIAGLFLPKGTQVASMKKQGGIITGNFKTNRTPLAIPRSLPIIIIVNNYTASASEILAGTLQIYADKKNLLSVFVIGDETFGKGSVQEVIPLSNESALKLTTGLYFLPFETSIQGKGVIPDFKLEYRTPPTETVKWMTSNYGKESALKGSIKPLGSEDTKTKEKKNTTQKEDEKTWKEKRKELLSQDYFVQNAINLIGLYRLGTAAHPKKLTTRNNALEFLKDNYVIDKPLNLEEIKLQ